MRWSLVGFPLGVVLGLLPLGEGTFQKLWFFPALGLGVILGAGGEIRAFLWHPKRMLWDLAQAVAMGVGGALLGGGLGLLMGWEGTWRTWLALGMIGASAYVPHITPGRGGALWGYAGNLVAWMALWPLSGNKVVSLALGVGLGIFLELAYRLSLPLVGVYAPDRGTRPVQLVVAEGRGASEALLRFVGISGILLGAFLCYRFGADPLLVGGGAGLWWVNTTLRRYELLRWLRTLRPWAEGFALLVLGALFVHESSEKALVLGGLMGAGICAGRLGGGVLADLSFPLRVHPKLWLRRLPQGPLALALAYQACLGGELLWGATFAAGTSLLFLLYRRGRFGGGEGTER